MFLEVNRIKKNFETKKIESVYFHQQTSGTLFILWWGQRNPTGTTYTRAVVSRSSGKMKLDSSSWYVKAGLPRFCGDHVRVFFCKPNILYPGSRSPSSKYLRWNKPVNIKLKLFLLGVSRLVVAASPRTISIDKKKKIIFDPGYTFC